MFHVARLVLVSASPSLKRELEVAVRAAFPDRVLDVQMVQAVAPGAEEDVLRRADVVFLDPASVGEEVSHLVSRIGAEEPGPTVLQLAGSDEHDPSGPGPRLGGDGIIHRHELTPDGLRPLLLTSLPPQQGPGGGDRSEDPWEDLPGPEQILQGVSDLFLALDRSWRLTFVNRAAEAFLQRDAKDLLGTNIWTAFPGLQGTSLRQILGRALRDGRSLSVEGFQWSPGRILDLRAYPSEDGVALSLQEADDSVSDRNRLKLLEVSLERTNDIVLITEAQPIDHPGPRIVYVNDAFERRTGFSREEAIGSTPRILQGPRTQRDALDRIRSSLEEWKPVREELINYAKSGEEFWLELEIVPVADDHGWYTHWIAIQRDITERKRGEERLAHLAALLDEATDAILVRGLDGTIEFWNRSAERIFGWSASDVLGEREEELLHPDPQQYRKALGSTMESGSWAGELELRTRSGQKLVVQARWTLVRDPQGEGRSILSIQSDVTERRKLEAQYYRAQRLESLGTLAGGIAHDLNNVLSPIMMAAEMLRMTETDPGRLETLETILSSAGRGSRMVAQVLAFAKGTEGRRVEVSVRRLLDDVRRILQDTLPKNIDLQIRCPPDAGVVLGDPTQLQQVLLNLCVNARDAMPEGGMITLSAANEVVDAHYAAMTLEATPGPHVRIVVEDEGVGIPGEILDRIFDPFFTTKGMGEGTGLGLPTSLSLVKGHGGFFRVESEPGRGTRFSVFLPARGSLEEEAADAGLPSEELPVGRGETILVVDDEDAILRITRQTLEAFGYRVLTAGDGTEAVGIYAREQDSIDLIVTDLMMPVLDGHATIKVLRRMNPRVPVIATSGVPPGPGGLAGGGAARTHFLRKPYGADTLLVLIREVLDRDDPVPNGG